jgi:hypothetical protein
MALRAGAYGWPLRAALVLLLAVPLVLRCYQFLVSPSLRVEDGAKIFAFFFDRRAWWTLWRF